MTFVLRALIFAGLICACASVKLSRQMPFSLELRSSMAWETLIDILPYSSFASEKSELQTLAKSVSKQALLFVSFDPSSGSAIPVVGNPAASDRARQSLMEHAFLLHKFPTVYRSDDRAINDLRVGYLSAKFLFQELPGVASACKSYARSNYITVYFDNTDHILFNWLTTAFPSARITTSDPATMVWSILLAPASSGSSNADSLCVIVNNATKIPSGTAYIDFSTSSSLWTNPVQKLTGFATARSGGSIQFHSAGKDVLSYLDLLKPPILSPYVLGACNEETGFCFPSAGPLAERAQAVGQSTNVRRVNISNVALQRGSKPWSSDKLMLNMFESYPTTLNDKLALMQLASANESVFDIMSSPSGHMAVLSAKVDTKQLYMISRQLLQRHSLGYAFAAGASDTYDQSLLVAWNAEYGTYRLSVARGLAALFAIVLFMRRIYSIDRFGPTQAAITAKYFHAFQTPTYYFLKLSKSVFVVDIMMFWILLAAFIDICVTGEFLGPADVVALPTEFIAFQYALIIFTVLATAILYGVKLWNATQGDMWKSAKLWFYWSIKYTAWFFVLKATHIILSQLIAKESIPFALEMEESQSKEQKNKQKVRLTASLWEMQLATVLGIVLLCQTVGLLFHFNPSNLFSRASLAFVYGLMTMYLFYNALSTLAILLLDIIHSGDSFGTLVYGAGIVAVSVANFVLYWRSLLMPFLYTISYGSYDVYMVDNAVVATTLAILGLFVQDIVSSCREGAQMVLKAHFSTTHEKKNL